MAAWQAMQAMIDIDGDHLQGMSKLGWLGKPQRLQTGLQGKQAACTAGLTTGSNMPSYGCVSCAPVTAELLLRNIVKSRQMPAPLCWLQQEIR